MRWKLVQWITVKSTDLSDFLLRRRSWNYTADDYRAMPENSLGRRLIDYMDENGIPFKPRLVRHDLKHIILDYEMNMPDELRIHAFLIGNRCYNPVAIAYLVLCTMIVPEIIPTLRKDFRRGRSAVCLRSIDLQSYLKHDLTRFKAQWNIPRSGASF